MWQQKAIDKHFVKQHFHLLLLVLLLVMLVVMVELLVVVELQMLR